MKNNKSIIILGPTATGKTKLAVNVAEKYNGEIISADSRQIYKTLDIGTGKDLKEYKTKNKKIEYHLINIINPNTNYSVYSFQKDFIESYKNIINKNKRPIICGGTGVYIESLLLNYNLSDKPPPNYELRNELSKKNIQELLELLEKVNINIIKEPKIDTKNRIIRNIEICLNKNKKKKTNHVLPIKNYIVIGINPGRSVVRENITNRLKKRLKEGLIEEVIALLKNGITHERLNYFGLEYRFISKYLKNDYNENQLFEKLNSAIHQFSKKQMTFFRRMEKRKIKIHWIDNNNIKLIKELI